MNVNVVII